MADEPFTVGAGRAVGQRSARLVCAASISASGPRPPAENVTVSPGTATGDRPLPVRASRVLTGTQPDPCRTRTGSTVSRSFSPPPGSAVTVVVPVVSPATVTGRPVLAASRAAACCSRPAVLSGVPPNVASFRPSCGVAGSGRGLPGVAALAVPGAAGVAAAAGVDSARTTAAAAMTGMSGPRRMALPSDPAGPQASYICRVGWHLPPGIGDQSVA